MCHLANMSTSLEMFIKLVNKFNLRGALSIPRFELRWNRKVLATCSLAF